MNQKKFATSGEVRVATRTDFSAAGWSYQTIDATSSEAPVAGYDVALAKTNDGILATWLTSAPSVSPKPNRIRWSYIGDQPTIEGTTISGFGDISQYLSTDGEQIAFNCAKRLCTFDIAKKKTSYVGESENPNGISSTWVFVNRVKYLIAGINGELSMLRP
jgi:hypothetical protein